MKKKLMRTDNTCAWSGDIKSTGSSAGNTGAAVIKAYSEGVNLNGAEMNGAEMNGAKMNGAKMNYAEMNYAEMNYAEMNYAKMNGAKMNGAEMNYAEMNYAEMNGAKMNGAKMNGANFHAADMRHVSRDEDAKIARLDVCAWPVTIQDTGVYIGCKIYTLDQIMSMTEEKANIEHSAAGIRWRRWGKALQALALATLVNNKPEAEVVSTQATTLKSKRIRKAK